MKRTLMGWITLSLALLLLAGCGSEQAAAEPSQASQPPSTPVDPDSNNPPPAPEPDMQQDYIDRVVQDTIAKFTEPGMGEYEKAKAAFDYIIETTHFLEPVGLDLWRIRGDYKAPPSFVENRSLSVLLFNIGKCEDYAAALTLLLRGMGIEAEYVPGLTYSAAGTGLVDHSWTVAKIDGTWYHLDCQLEANISKRGTIRYRYFMRGDSLVASHRWGQNLIDTGLLTPEQNAELARDFIAPVCPVDYPTPEPRSFTATSEPNVLAITTDIEAEFRAYELTNGPLAPIDLPIVPPVFGYEGYGDPNS